MPKLKNYKVMIEEKVLYVVRLKAADYEEAEKMAEDMLVNGEIMQSGEQLSLDIFAKEEKAS